MGAQVGRPWLAAVLASGLPRLPKGVTVRLRLKEFCTSAERLAWAKANGCPWGGTSWMQNGLCAFAAEGGHLEAGTSTRPLLSSTRAVLVSSPCFASSLRRVVTHRYFTCLLEIETRNVSHEQC
jgi:hypothetical protein